MRGGRSRYACPALGTRSIPRRTLDFSQPVAVMLLGILNFVVDDGEAIAVVRRLMDALPAGSYLAVSHPTREVSPEAVDRAVEMRNAGGAAAMRVRTPEQIARFFDGLDLRSRAVARRAWLCAVWPELPEWPLFTSACDGL
ncbi:SAM-dependent methyltransferase [Micromonospora sp. LZ34]